MEPMWISTDVTPLSTEEGANFIKHQGSCPTNVDQVGFAECFPSIAIPQNRKWHGYIKSPIHSYSGDLHIYFLYLFGDHYERDV